MHEDKTRSPLKRLNYFGLLALLLVIGGCSESDSREMELRRSFKNYVHSVAELHQAGLEHYVYFPNVRDYKMHVQGLLMGYMDQASSAGQIILDEQGVVLTRFLRLTYHNYEVLSISEIDEQDVKMRIAINFSYTALLKAAAYEEGTKVYLPTKPFGQIYTFEVGGENEIPRDELSYIEIELVFRKTNVEGYWQLRRCVADPDTAKFAFSMFG